MRRLGTFQFSEELDDLADRRARRAPRNSKSHMRAVEFDRAVALMLQPPCGSRGDQPVFPRPQRKVRDRRFRGNPGNGRIVNLVLGHPLVKPPNVVLMRIAGEGGAERNHRPHPVRALASNFTREQSAEAPAHEQYRRFFANPVEMIAQPIDRVVTHASVPAHAPAVNPPTRSSERLAERRGRPVGRKETWNYYCRRPVRRSNRPTRAESIDEASKVPAQLDQPPSTRRQSVVTSEMIA